MPQPFAWGANDCCSFAGDGVVATTGTDPMADLRGVASARQALRVLQAWPLPALVTQRLGQPVCWQAARRGDVVLLEQGGRQLLGLCLGAQWVAPGHAGAVTGPMNQCHAAWAVG